MICVYKIRNIENDKIYIGSTKDFKKRCKQHITKLRNKIHINTVLQNSWNKYGENCFVIEVIEECTENDLFEREQYYLDTMKPFSNEGGFNIGKKSCGGDNISNNPRRSEIIEKMTKSLIEKNNKLTQEEKNEKWARFGEDNPNFGNRWSEELREYFSKLKKETYDPEKDNRVGKNLNEIYGGERAEIIREKMSEFGKTRTGEKNSFFGREHTEETKEKLRNKRLGNYYGEQNIPFTIDGIEYSSLGVASKILGIHLTTIKHRLGSKNKKFDNYQYLNKETG